MSGGDCPSSIRYNHYPGLDGTTIMYLRCELPVGHRGVHRAGNLAWTTPAVRVLLGDDTSGEEFECGECHWRWPMGALGSLAVDDHGASGACMPCNRGAATPDNDSEEQA